jgi:hypothetical protein
MEVEIMENRIRINLGENLELVAELTNYDGNHPEISVYIEKDMLIHQDICLVRPHENEKCVQDKNGIDVIVWTDENNEDYTDKYQINIWEEENENV